MSVLVINPYRFAVAAAVTDSFNRTDSSTTMGNADTGQTWVPNDAGVWGISSNQAYRVSGADTTTVVESSLADCTITVTMVVGGDNGLCWRCSNNSNFFMLIASNGTCYKKEAGGFASMGDGASFTNGDLMTVVLAGDSHTIKKNGSTEFSFTSSFNQTATKHGLRGETSDGWFENFSVTA